MDRPVGFRFVARPHATGERAAHVVPISAGVRRKRELLACYDRALELPDYFGWNWDALEECLSDLTWLAPPPRVEIVHVDLPFAPRGPNRRTYFSLLQDVAAANRQVTVLFPLAVEADVARLLAL